MMRLVARMLFIGLLISAGLDGAAAQNIDQIIRDIGRLGQPRRATVQAEWDRIPAGDIQCVDDRLRRNRRSVNTLIDRGIGPSDNRVAGIVGECRANADAQSDTATPSFNCRFARQPDEQAICSNPELARLDRAVVDSYQQVAAREGSGPARGIADSLLRQRHACGPDIDCIKQVQFRTIAAFQARGASVQVPAPAPVAERANGYSVNGIQLGGNVVGNADYRNYACAPSPQYAGFTECQRQTAERSRRRRISESTSVIHAGDGSAAIINQSLEPVAMGDEDADDEIARLSATYGKATLLPLTDSRGVRSGVIAAWGAVSLLPLEPERRQALAAGTDDQTGNLIDHLGSPQRSAQLGLPVYRLAGGAGYVWSASWNGRGRGTLHVVAIDASKLPGGAETPKPAEPAPAPAAPATAAISAAPTVPAAEAPRPADPPAPTAPAAPAAAPSDQKLAAPAVQPPPKAPAPANVRVVGPPIELRPATSAAAAASTPSSSGGGNGLVYFLVALIIALLGAVAYLYRKTRVASSGIGAATPVFTDPPAALAAPAAASAGAETIAPVEPPAKSDEIAVPESKMDLPALVPAESPDSIAATKPDIGVSKDEAMTPGVSDATELEASKPIVASSHDK